MKNQILKTAVSILIVLALCAGGMSCLAAPVQSFHYTHDPRLNPAAMADILADPDAVYGFSPNPESKRLGTYAEYDFTDEAFVAEARENRIAYHESMRELYALQDALAAEGKGIEEIARAVSALRNEIRLRAYENDPEGLAKVKESNLSAYGNENGPTADSLYEKYGAWETVLEKAFSTNSGMDACLGLYDDYYPLYCLIGQISTTYYTQAMQWVYTNEFAAPITGEVYAPELGCTRAEAVTLLWMAAGAPADGTVDFADVSADSNYAAAVSWAYNNGITDGTGNGSFSPDSVCTRAQIVTMLYRMEGMPYVEPDGHFTDVAADAYYADAVAWAVGAGVTDGTGDSTFSPDADCTRGEVVTFLYRCLG